jgi:putative nucleotidyltransferase with HDIG domain
MKTKSDTVEIPLTEQVRAVAMSGDVVLPPLPQTGQRLLVLFNDPDLLDSGKVAEIVHTDPAIAAAMLKMANSAFFGGLQPIFDLSQAIGRLGLRRVAALVTTLVHKGQFETNDPHKAALLEGLWNQAVVSALAARRLATVTSGDPEESYLAGLLHDIGKLLALRAIDHVAARRPEIEVTPLILAEVLEADHAEFGHRVLHEWHFPEPICRAVRLHHDESCKDGLALRVQAADAIACKMGAHSDPDPDLVLEDVTAIERLNLTDLELAAMMVDLEDEIAALRHFL